MIHKYKLNGYNIVLDVNSGGVHVVDELTYDLLDNVSPPFSDECPENTVEKLSRFYDREDIISCYNEVRELYENEILFSGDSYEKLAGYSVPSPVKAMCLLVEQDCNLRCEYCFAGTGDYGTGHRMHMDFETGKKAIDFLIGKSEGRQNLEVDFFGGEPLMNFDVVRQLVEYGRSKEKEHDKIFRFTVTTNGLLLDDDKIDFINREMSNVVLSIDGRRDVNDRVRRRIDGAGCYDRILPKFKRLAKKRNFENYYVRGTFTKYNTDFSDDVFHLYSEGFDQISVEPVIGAAESDFSLTQKDLPVIFSEYERLAKRILDAREKGEYFNFFHFMLDLDQGPCAIKRLRGCGSGNEYVAVSPDGDIYPCHQFAGTEEYKMGNIHDGTFDAGMKAEFAGTHIYAKEDCKKCWAKFYCSGGCSANNYIFNRSINSAHKMSCEIQKKRIECAVMMKAAEAE